MRHRLAVDIHEFFYWFGYTSDVEDKRSRQMLLFLKVFLTEFIAEMGDKTQLMLIALTSKYKLRDIILGTAAAILVLMDWPFLLEDLSVNSFQTGSSKLLQHLHFSILLHRRLPVMMTMKRKRAVDQRSSSPRLQYFVHFS